MSINKPMRVAIVHDFLNQRGGAERVVAVLSRIWPEAPIFTSIYDPAKTFSEFQKRDVRTTFLQKLPHGDAAFRALLPLYPAAFRSMDLSGFDLVISSTTHWGHRVDAKGAHHVVYCHNPPRWLYQTDEYLAEAVLPGWTRPLVAPALSWLRRGDLAAARRPHKYICNSRVVAGRIRSIYGREAEVIPPPIETDRLAAAFERRSEDPPGGEHYLVVSRLLPYKRVDLAVEVCTARDVPLVVVGDGPASAELKRTAGPKVRFAGRVPDDEFLDLFARARGLIHCAYEDFGMVLLEANAAGIPVVAFGNGGALETVIPGETGILFPEQRGESLMRALDQFEKIEWYPATLRQHSMKYDERVFRSDLTRAVQRSLEGSAT